MPENKLTKFYAILRKRNGHQHWWPGETPFEVIIGAILTQSCSWTNVETAIGNIKRADALSPLVLERMPLAALGKLVRPTGYYKQKAKKIKSFLAYFKTYRYSIKSLRKRSMPELRGELLGVWGIGPETADSILCYALDKPAFVIDAYTRRLLFRLGLTAEDASYDTLQRFCIERVPVSRAVYNDFHAQIVVHCKAFCRTVPKCVECPLRSALCLYPNKRQTPR
ncbi:MAG: hypothetical protein HZC28_15140 [Spirochaetes bacterium]|nr:hypothetical protein [Spirochaetota bacterium]